MNVSPTILCPKPVTDRQLRVLRALVAGFRSRGFSPSLREIAEVLGIRSTNGVVDHLNRLERKGCITREDMKSRAIMVTPLGYQTAGVEPPEWAPKTRSAPKTESSQGLTQILNRQVLARVCAMQAIQALDRLDGPEARSHLEQCIGFLGGVTQ